jgi:hypothetical protein
MPSKIILKKSSVASKVPVAGDLDFGELAINYTDGKLYYKKADGTSIDSFITSASSITGNAATATALQTARTINGTSFNGTANITITAVNPNALTIGTGLTGTSYTGGSAVTIAIDSTVTTLTGTQTLTNKTVSGLVLNDGYTEEIFAVTGTTPALSPANGSIQTWTLTANSTPTIGTWVDGQSVTLMIDDGTNYSITWPTISWTTTSASPPVLRTTGYTTVVLWEVGSVIYGKY